MLVTQNWKDLQGNGLMKKSAENINISTYQHEKHSSVGLCWDGMVYYNEAYRALICARLLNITMLEVNS